MKIKSPNGKEFDFLIGADPEFFVQRFGKLVSAHGLVPGTKERPFVVKKGAVQVDGMALEFNIDPAETYAMFEDHMVTVLDSITKMVPGYEILVQPVAAKPEFGNLAVSVADFGKEYIDSQPDEAKALGCNPDFNAYTRLPNPTPKAETPFRTASGHIHIGWRRGADVNNEGHLEACRALTKSLDVWLGIPSLVWDKDDRRRELYGAAGAFRPKSYGMEYRVLSNAWITNPLLRKTVFYNTIKAIEHTFADEDYGSRLFMGMTARDIISKKNGWKDAALYAIKYDRILTPSHYR